MVLFSIPFAVAHLAGLFVNIRHNTGRKHTSTAGSKIIKRASSMLQKQTHVQIFSILGVGNTFQAGHVWHPEELIKWNSALLTGWVTASFPRLLEHSSFFTSVWPHRPRLLANRSRDHANDVAADAAICWDVGFFGHFAEEQLLVVNKLIDWSTYPYSCWEGTLLYRIAQKFSWPFSSFGSTVPL